MRAWGLAVASLVVVAGGWLGLAGPDTSPVDEDAVAEARPDGVRGGAR